MVLPLILVVLLLGTALAPWVTRVPARLQPWLLPAPAVVAFCLLALSGQTVTRTGQTLFFATPWVPQLNLDLALRLDGLALLLAGLVTGIGACIMIYATGYMHGDALANRLYAYLYAFMFAMTGVALADHLLILFIFWELTGVTSYLLIGFNHSDADARKNALQALLVTGLGGIALLAATILLAQSAGTWLISDLVAERQQILSSSTYPAILTLTLLAAFTKSAQFPFHFWLPNAMGAPTPVSAYLHSATMVKAGVYLMAVMLPIIGGTQAWTLALILSGGLTVLSGASFGLRHHDLKKVLAGSTLSVLGLLTLLLGIGSSKAVLAALLFLLGHALYKATLFMVAGAVDHATGTRDGRMLGGLRAAMPWTAAAALLAALSKIGLPPFLGFIGKEYTYKATLAGPLAIWITSVLIVGNAVVLALAAKAAILPFWTRAKGALPKPPHEAPWSMRVGPLLLAALGLATGCFPRLVEPLVAAGKSAALGRPVEAHVMLWHGFNLPLALSAVTIALGCLVTVFRDPIGRTLSAVRLPGAEDAYKATLAGVLRFAHWQTRLLQSGYLRHYLIIIIVATFTLILAKLWRFGIVLNLGQMAPTGVLLPALVVIMLAAIVIAVLTMSRITTLVALGVVGFGVALIFAYFSAPDLAITQILVETLTVVLFAWVVYKLPAYRIFSGRRTVFGDALIAGGAGGVITLLLLKTHAINFGGQVSEHLSAISLPEAHGANVVNVILVDFRAIDTWGEICVLSIAALGVWALMKQHAPRQQAQAQPQIPSPILHASARDLGPLLFILSLVVLYRGHNAPGGGFIGGLIAAAAVLLYALAGGYEHVTLLRRLTPMRLIIAGLATAMLSGLPALLRGEPFMTGLWLPKLQLPLIGKVQLGTPFLFDVGVYLTVIGFTLRCSHALRTAGPNESIEED